MRELPYGHRYLIKGPVQVFHGVSLMLLDCFLKPAPAGLFFVRALFPVQPVVQHREHGKKFVGRVFKSVHLHIDSLGKPLRFAEIAEPRRQIPVAGQTVCAITVMIPGK